MKLAPDACFPAFGVDTIRRAFFTGQIVDAKFCFSFVNTIDQSINQLYLKHGKWLS